MLEDIERKVLRILGNYSSVRRRMPTLKELRIKTGRSQRGVLLVLSTLEKEGYILWKEDDPENIVIIEAWERRSSLPPTRFNPDRFMD
ncbi:MULTISPECIES: hypothetical protein [unclassified Paenibacillus]|uniref:hypothetical protein n=1 Tax=unclassified Paenibacillus TaxID=185978 RepID=UPI001AE160BC|nr:MULTISPECIES: hypothetical protein [unclassified Paenibacillus]MBP1156060.1 putative membrane protein [Paenibacillus sp. PvP091]MBP1168554.1 putative membrane protein [Paenibacillus sp. PvR098]MBP2439582.1 putative membrane protein [Paenibacillus sp. PvP052]